MPDETRMTAPAAPERILAPCPFCGGPAELWRAQAGRTAWVACMGRCAVLVSQEHKTDDEAVAMWNTRALPQPAPGIERVAEAARVLLEAWGEDKWGRWEVPRKALDAAIDVHGLALGDISPLGFRCSPQVMLAASFRAALSALSQPTEAPDDR